MRISNITLVLAGTMSILAAAAGYTNCTCPAVVLMKPACEEVPERQPENASEKEPCHEDNLSYLLGANEKRMIETVGKYLQGRKDYPEDMVGPSGFKVHDSLVSVDFWKCSQIFLLDSHGERVLDQVRMNGYIKGIRALRRLRSSDTGLEEMTWEVLLTTFWGCGTGTWCEGYTLLHVTEKGLKTVVEYVFTCEHVIWHIQESAAFIPSYTKDARPSMQVVVHRLESNELAEEDNWEPVRYEHTTRTDTWVYDKTTNSYLQKK